MVAVAKRHKKHKHEEHVDESWLVPYADILTLLLALFIVLFASSSIDAQKFQKLSAVFNTVFEGGSGVMNNPSPVEVLDPKSDVQSKGEATPKSPSTEYLEDQEALGKVKDKVDNFIANNELENQFKTKLTDEGLLITIRDNVLYAPGQATVKQEYIGLAKELSQILIFNPQRNIIVTGHTDNVPMNTREFGSNWELSVMRAVNFLKLMVNANSQLDPMFVSAKGYGEYQPVATNATAEGRAKNRRVEVLIQPLVLKDGTTEQIVNP